MRELEKDNIESTTNTREIVLNSSTKKDKKKDKTISTAKKSKFKWKYQIILAVGLILMITATILLSLPTKMDKFLTRWEGANLSKETVIREISEKKLLDEIGKNKGYVFVFYGTPDSEEAKKQIAVVEKAAQDFKKATLNSNQELTVYWLDATELNKVPEEDRGATDFKTDIDNREKALQDVDLFKIPSFWYYKDGKIIRDTADVEDTEFLNVVNKAFGEYAQSLQK